MDKIGGGKRRYARGECRGRERSRVMRKRFRDGKLVHGLGTKDHPYRSAKLPGDLVQLAAHNKDDKGKTPFHRYERRGGR